METVRLGPFNVPRVWTGLWQLSSNAWGSAPVSKIQESMRHHVEMGYTAFGKLSFFLSVPGLELLIVPVVLDMAGQPFFIDPDGSLIKY